MEFFSGSFQSGTRHAHNDQIIGYRMAEMNLSMANSRNIVIALRLFLTLTVSVASVERSFSKLKPIKSYLRSSMSQDWLSNLSLISIEHKTVEKIDFGQVISHFASAKTRKIKI